MATPKHHMNPFVRFLTITLTIITAVVVYAFAFERTDIDLKPVKDEQRRTQLIRIVRGLARPDLIAHNEVVTFHLVDVMTPCPPGGFTPTPPDTTGPYLEMFPSCALPGSEVTVRGFNFDPGEEGPLSFIPPSGVTLGTATIVAGDDGSFSRTYRLPDRPDETVQQLRFTTRERTGGWTWSETAQDSWDKIIETLMLALVATTLGTAVAIPLSFLSARNLMRTIRSPLSSVALFVIGLPVGILVGRQVGRWVTDTGEGIGDSLPILLGGAAAIVIALGWLLRVTMPEEDDAPPTPWMKAGRWGIGAVVALGGLFAIGFLGRALLEIGLDLEDALGPLGFLGGFVRVFGDLLTTFLTVVAAIVTGTAFALLGSRAGHLVKQKLPDAAAGLARFVLGGMAVAVLAATLGGAVQWLYQLDATSNARATTAGGFLLALVGGVLAGRRARKWISMGWGLVGTVLRLVLGVVGTLAGLFAGIGLGMLADFAVGTLFAASGTLWAPALLGAALGVVGVYFARGWDQLPSGMAAYYFARTFFNVIRSVEPLVMAIVFVVWVGVGPFAGAIALALHTTASLAKLYSEQVESIMEGPIEAVTATGATRLQSIVYAVVPQIVPPYIAFTLYRWDINVRMSTIIGFAGGGGIGFLLQQNINLLLYRAAAVQMLAIAIVVGTLDFVSARIRERIV
ncbi:MAG TPA: ABC transporter permease subunit [Acidimicrobiia bacterium]|nr:ABC transporter permease subunit [Acidimicrobiia bacterium]